MERFEPFIEVYNILQNILEVVFNYILIFNFHLLLIFLWLSPSCQADLKLPAFFVFPFALGHPTISDAAEREPPALNRTRLYRKWRAWHVSTCMTNVSQQVGALKQNHKQSWTVWKYINHQTALWLTTARKQLGSNSGVCTWYSGVAWVQLQVKLSDFFSFKMESSPKSRFGLSVLIHIYMA